MSARPVFVVGMPRSGTSWFVEQLASRYQLFIARETQFLPEVYGALLRARSGGSRGVVDAWLAREPWLAPVASGMPREPGPQPMRFLSDMLSELAGRHGEDRWVEKTPRHLEHLDVILEELPDAVAVVLHRSPRDVVASLTAMPWADPDPLFHAARWQAYAELARRGVQRWGDRVVELRYEDLIGNWEAGAARLQTVVRLPSRTRSRTFATFDPDSEPWKHASGGPTEPRSGQRPLPPKIERDVALLTRAGADRLRYPADVDCAPAAAAMVRLRPARPRLRVARYLAQQQVVARGTDAPLWSRLLAASGSRRTTPSAGRS